MSTGGAGEFAIIAAPAAVAAGAAVLLVAGTGVVIYQGGKALIKCGRAVKAAVNDHLEKQKAINELCRQYEESYRAIARASRFTPTVCGLQISSSRRARMERHQQQVIAAIPEPQLVIPEDPGLTESLPTTSYSVFSDIPSAGKQLQDELDRVGATLKTFDAPEWGGLVPTSDLHARLQKLAKSLQQNLATKDQPASELNHPGQYLYDIGRQIGDLRRELARRAAEAKDKANQRKDAADALIRASTELERLQNNLSDTPTVIAGLDMAGQLLEQAEEFFENGNLIAAQTTAESTIGYLGLVVESADELRKNNALTALDALKQHVDEYKLEDNWLANAIYARIERARDLLQSGNYEDFWLEMEAAQNEAAQLAAEVIEDIGKEHQRQADRVMRDSLIEMGYGIVEAETADDGSRQYLKAQRQDGAYFLVWIGADGTLQYKAEGFDKVECQKETKKLVEKLKENGVVATLSSALTLTASVERLREAMLRSGFTGVRQEVSPDGKSVTLIGTRDGENEEKFPVGMDGVVEEETPAENQQQADRPVTRSAPNYAATQNYYRLVQRRRLTN